MKSRRFAYVSLVTGLAFGSALAAGPVPAPPLAAQRPVFNGAAFRPQLVLVDVVPVTDASFTTISGVVFSRAPIDRISVGERSASMRQAQPNDLARIARLPKGASEMPYRTYFELPDAALPHVGANDLEVVAIGNDGRASDLHRVTVLRSAPPTTN